MNKFNHVMLDLETMGNRSNAAIVSIAAVPFNMETGEISNDIFYKRVDLESSLEVGLKVQGSTIYWWLQQNEEARKELCKPADHIMTVLPLLSSFLEEYGGNYKIWGNGVRFDLGLLEDAYFACGYTHLPWNFRNERDVRTLVAFAPHIKASYPKVGAAHNPVDDCKFQIGYCSTIYNKLKF